MIGDRRYLAAQVRNVSQALDELSLWTENPDRPFPGDAVTLASQLRGLAELLIADDLPGGQAG